MAETKRTAEKAPDMGALREGDGAGQRSPARVIATIVFLAAVPALVGGLGALRNSHRNAPDSAASLPKAERVRPEESAGRLEFVGPDAPLTPISTPAFSAAPPADADAPMALEKWPDGRDKVTSREWSHQGAAMEELCYYERGGSLLGCGLLRDGDKWEGIFARWSLPPGQKAGEASVLRELVSYRNGLKDGVSRAYRFDGSPMLETTFREGRQIKKRVFTRQGNEIIDIGSQRIQGLPESRRSRNTAD